MRNEINRGVGVVLILKEHTIDKSLDIVWNVNDREHVKVYLCDFTEDKEGYMTRVTITLHVPPAKRRELLQSLDELICLMQQEPD